MERYQHELSKANTIIHLINVYSTVSAPDARDATTDESKRVVYGVTNQGSLIRTYTRWFLIAVGC